MSFYDRLGDRFELWSGSQDHDLDFYAALAARADGPILELAVGDGRVAVPVARAAGRKVIGIDLSTNALERAADRAAAAGIELDLRQSDMLEFEVDEPHALIYCPARSLLHIPDWAGRRRLFERIHDALRPGGRFAWNVFAFDHRFAAELDGVPQQQPTPHVNRYDVADNRVDIELDDGATTSLWWATKNEWLGLIDVAGLELESLHGDFEGGPLTSSTSEYVFVARRAG